MKIYEVQLMQQSWYQVRYQGAASYGQMIVG